MSAVGNAAAGADEGMSSSSAVEPAQGAGATLETKISTRHSLGGPCSVEGRLKPA